MRVLTRLLLLAALLLAVAPRPSHAQGDLLGRINALRASLGRAPYTLNSALSAAAQDQAQWMASTGSVSHTRPDGSGPRTRAAAYGYPSAQVSENIYGGTNASADSAWNFWLNSGVHYAGMVNPNYNEIGIGSASGSWGSTFVLVFGNSGGPSLAAVSASSGGAGAAAAGPPSYVVGTDEYGNIMHEVQPGDTLGDIALIYGYTWDDLPAMMALNQIVDVRDLEVGSVFLVPPKAGTYTPVPTTPPPTLTPTPVPPTLTPYVALRPVNAATIQVTPLAALTQPPTATVAGIATAAAAPAWLETASPPPETTPSPTASAESTTGAVAVALAPTLEPVVPAAVLPPTPENNTNTLLIVAILVQVGVIGAAAISFMRSGRKGRRP